MGLFRLLGLEGFSEEEVQRVWNKADKAAGYDPDKYRVDACGILIFRRSYGKKSRMGWEIDHIKPKSKGGSDSIRNLQALHWRNNRAKGNTYPADPKKYCLKAWKQE